MKPSQFLSRKMGLGLFAALLVFGFAWVVARSGPLSPIQVTTRRVESGSLAPSDIWHWHCRGAGAVI